jgi:hypothetical protein
LAGIVTFRPPAVGVKLSGMVRVFWSKPCVIEPVRTSITEEIPAASGVWMNVLVLY